MSFKKHIQKFRILCDITSWVNTFDCVPLKVILNTSKAVQGIQIIAKNKQEIRILTYKVYLNYFAAFVQLLQLCAYAKQGRHTTNFVFGMFALLSIFGTTSFTYLCKNKGQIWSSYQNNLSEFKRKYKRKGEIGVYDFKYYLKSSSVVRDSIIKPPPP